MEGPDECGKTTLAKAMALENNGVYLHSTATPALFPALMDYHRSILENVKANLEMGRDVILDRFWPSEYVYGLNLFRPHSGYSPSEMMQAVEELHGKYVYCFSRKGLERYRKGHVDPAHSLTDEQYRRVYACYTQCYHQQMVRDSKSCHIYIMEQDAATDNDFNRFIQILNLWNQ